MKELVEPSAARWGLVKVIGLGNQIGVSFFVFLHITYFISPFPFAQNQFDGKSCLCQE